MHLVGCNIFLTIFMKSCIYCAVESRKALADEPWVTKIHNLSVFIVTASNVTLLELVTHNHLFVVQRLD